MTDFALSYTEYGTGQPLLLLHGNGEESGYFSAQIDAFAKRFRVITVDTRGHGRSPRGTAPFTLAQFADDLLALLNHLSIAKADILGFSDGGNIALIFALNYPGRVNRMVINGANLYPSGMKLLPWLMIDLLYLGACIAACLTPKAIHRRELLALMATQPHISAEALRTLPMPVLVLAGTRDLIRDSHTRLIARSLPNGQLLLLAGGHTIAQTQSQAYNEAVLSFFDAY